MWSFVATPSNTGGGVEVEAVRTLQQKMLVVCLQGNNIHECVATEGGQFCYKIMISRSNKGAIDGQKRFS